MLHLKMVYSSENLNGQSLILTASDCLKKKYNAFKMQMFHVCLCTTDTKGH